MRSGRQGNMRNLTNLEVRTWHRSPTTSMTRAGRPGVGYADAVDHPWRNMHPLDEERFARFAQAGGAAADPAPGFRELLMLEGVAPTHEDLDEMASELAEHYALERQ
jgi:hypothetical protein